MLSSCCGKNGIRRQEWSSVLTRRSPRSTAVHTGAQQLGARFRRQDEHVSRLRRERDGQRCAGMPDRNRTWSACPRRRRCQPLPGRKLPQHNERGGRRSRLLRGSPLKAELSTLDASFDATTNERLTQTGLAPRVRQRKLAIDYIPERGRPSGRFLCPQFRLHFELEIFPISDRLSAM